MLLFYFVLFGATLPLSRAKSVTYNYDNGDFNGIEAPNNISMDLGAGSGAVNKIPNILQLIPSGCGPYKTCNEYATVVHLYEAMNCTPSKALSKFCCPVSYDCKKTFSSRSKTRCQYKGKTYAVGAKVPNDPDLPCITNITCSLKDKVPGFTYKRTTCPTVKAKANTIQLYSFKSCCSTGSRSAVLTAKEFKCVFNNKSYPIGADIPSFGCITCICAIGFDGTLREPWCKRTKCSYELDAQNNILKGYAPVYGVAQCCPFKWIPPISKSVCTLGEKKVKFGDGLASTVSSTSCVMCACMVGPSLECAQFDDCSAALASLMSQAVG